MQHSPIAVVTGGTAGIGRATVDALLDRGYRVAVLARGTRRLEALSRTKGNRVWTRSVDVGDGAALDRAGDAIVDELGVPDVWVNNAMLTSLSPFAEVDEAEFRKITDTTYLGTVNGCRTALRIMARGNIVNVGSGLAYASIPNQAAYCGAKHAIEGFTQSLRIELAQARRPITLSMVQLPAVNTPQFDWSRNRMDRKQQPAPPIFQPEVAAAGVMKAIDGHAREILVGRSVLQLMVANMLFPTIVERKLTKIGTDIQTSERPDRPRLDNLDSPVEDYPGTSHGPYDDRAAPRGMVVDGDAARAVFVAGGVAALLAAGLLLGRATASRKRGPRPLARPRATPAYLRPAGL
ncbi:SDR family oxidoreductase [uncultured Jannaschia sp.]|uniref:SDR family oxidoreductase n=1 Tax=uncultured Jannaschia sp. TaxID=293347 RepID=UPI002633D670|nr:SDR family oxidoreductase [uncultured Jannaschia sp.]